MTTPDPAERISRFLQPGEFAIGDARYRLRTLLGSCVSITLWHPRERVGTMSHFLLPARGGGRGPAEALDGRYGADALELMLQALERRQVNGRQCVARIFGGGNMFPNQAPRPGGLDVGRRNGEAARVLLQQHGLAVSSEHLFGIGHRRLDFDIATGEVKSEQVSPGEAPRTSPGSLHSAPGTL